MIAVAAALEGQVLLRSGAAIAVGGATLTPRVDGPVWAARVVADEGETLVVEVGESPACIPGLALRGPLDTAEVRVARGDLVPVLGEVLREEHPFGRWWLEAGVPVLDRSSASFRTVLPRPLIEGWSSTRALYDAVLIQRPVPLAWSAPWRPRDGVAATVLDPPLEGTWLGWTPDAPLRGVDRGCGGIERPGENRLWAMVHGGMGGCSGSPWRLRQTDTDVHLRSTHAPVMSWAAAPVVSWPNASPAGSTRWSAERFEVVDGRLTGDVRFGSGAVLSVTAPFDTLIAGGVEALVPIDATPRVLRSDLDSLAACLVPARQRPGGLAEQTLPWPSASEHARRDDRLVHACVAALPRLRRGEGTLHIHAGAWPSR